LNTFNSKEHSIDQIGDIGKGIDRLTNQVFQVRLFTKPYLDALFKEKMIPEANIVKELIDAKNKQRKEGSSDACGDNFILVVPPQNRLHILKIADI